MESLYTLGDVLVDEYGADVVFDAPEVNAVKYQVNIGEGEYITVIVYDMFSDPLYAVERVVEGSDPEIENDTDLTFSEEDVYDFIEFYEELYYVSEQDVEVELEEKLENLEADLKATAPTFYAMLNNDYNGYYGF